MTKIMSWNIEKFTKAKITSDPFAKLSIWQRDVIAATATTPLDFLKAATDQCKNKAYGSVTFPADTTAFDCVIGSGMTSLTSNPGGVVEQAITATTASTSTANFISDYVSYLNDCATSSPTTPPQIIINRLKIILNAAFKKTPPSTIEEVVKIVFERYLGQLVKSSNISMDNIPFLILQQLAIELVNTTAATTSSMQSVMKKAIDTSNTISKELLVFNHIRKNISPNASQIPDILVVFEVISQNSVPRYTAIDGGGAQGIMLLLKQLRDDNSIAYSLVPPVRLAPDVPGAINQDLESIAVFYNSDKLQFQGPNIWNGTLAYNPSSPIATDSPSDNYGADFSPPPTTGVLPAGVSDYALPNKTLGTPIGTGPFAANNENELAGRTNFTPLSFITPNDRPPLFTQFQEYKAGEETTGKPTGRIIKLFAMHPNRSNAPKAIAELDKIAEIQSISANEVGVVVGDFNVELEQSGIDPSTDYGPLINRGYTLVFSVKNKYVGTMLAGKKLLNGTYPTYGYILALGPLGSLVDVTGTSPIWPSSLDNILVKHGTPATKTYSAAMILNRVVGVDLTNSSSLTSMPNPEYGYNTSASTPLATSPYGYVMSASIETIRNPKDTSPTPLDVSGTNENSTMLQLKNYGQIKATSDHMALVVEV